MRTYDRVLKYFCRLYFMFTKMERKGEKTLLTRIPTRIMTDSTRCVNIRTAVPAFRNLLQ